MCGNGNEGCFKDPSQPRLCLQSLTAESVLNTIEIVLSEKASTGQGPLDTQIN